MGLKINKALILAAGFGSRLRPLTEKTPKPLLPVQGKPMLAHTIEKIAEVGINKIIVNTHYHAEQIHAFLDNYKGGDIEISVEHEESILDVGGGVLNVMQNYAPAEPLLVMNSDVLLEGSLQHLIDAWDGDKMQALLLLYQRENGKGDFDLSAKNKIIRHSSGGKFTWTGISILHPAMFAGYNVKKFHICELLFRASDEEYDKYQYYGLLHQHKWLDIGEIVNYEYACNSWLKENAV